jgi:multisubunit Na+/H+ antiporter MnhB subunit
MVILRFIAMIGLTIMGVAVVAYFVTWDRRWLRFAWQVFKFGAVLATAVGLLMLAERLLLPIL